MITIENLEIQFDVAGDDKDRFVELFKECIRRWAAERENLKERERRAARDRSLGDAAPKGMHS